MSCTCRRYAPGRFRASFAGEMPRPRTVAFSPPRRIFAGALPPARHPAPEVFSMSREQGRQVTFRVASDSSAPLQTTAQLEEQLNRRLRILCGILAVAMGALAITAVIDR